MHVDERSGVVLADAERLLEVWAGNDLIKTLIRESGGEIRKKRAERTART